MVNYYLDVRSRIVGICLIAWVASGCDSTQVMPESTMGYESVNPKLNVRQAAAADLSQTGTLVNGGFDNPIGIQPGWEACVDDNALAPNSFGGIDVGPQECILQIVDIDPGTTNTLSCLASASNPELWSGLGVSFYDTNGEFISESDAVRVTTESLRSRGPTTRMPTTGLAPANTDKAIVWFYTESGGRIDNCEFNSSPGGLQNDPQRYRKTLEVTTRDGNGRYIERRIPRGGFGYNGRHSLNSYPTITSDSSIIDGFELADERRWGLHLGLAEGYLHVVTTIQKGNGIVNVPRLLPELPLDSPDLIWNDDSFEIYINAGNETSSGYDENDYLSIHRFTERQGVPLFYTGDNSQLTLSAGSGICERELNNATSCEVRFRLDELGISGQDVAEIGFDVHVNFDDDGGERDAKYSWCSGDTVEAWRDMSVIDCSLRIINDCETNCEGF